MHVAVMLRRMSLLTALELLKIFQLLFYRLVLLLQLFILPSAGVIIKVHLQNILLREWAFIYFQKSVFIFDMLSF